MMFKNKPDSQIASKLSPSKSFFDLPPEMRNAVYDEVLVREAPYNLPDTHYYMDIAFEDFNTTMHPVHAYPTGYFKPFTLMHTAIQWHSLGEVEYTEEIGHKMFPKVFHVNNQMRMESMSYLVREKLYIGLEGTLALQALDEFCAILPPELLRSIIRVHVGLRANVKVKRSQEEIIAYDAIKDNLTPTERWTIETGKDPITRIWPLSDVSSSGLPIFQILHNKATNTLQIKSHYALLPDQATKIKSEIEKYSGAILNGSVLLDIATWLRLQDRDDTFEADGENGERFCWQFEALGDEVVFHDRETMKGQWRDWYSPKRNWGHVLAEVDVLSC
ncbi:hypothetical protein EJ08DRAFT_732360 [Tothia fuscella]|uniref:Uncharacterized protein n=1 Tax=Tothia fuscella TaxID=1048955 RepID=A0A9P4U0N3_9PEZI|nr:hypothetical protein EJ08DRAFT_732360 [Tothia fuscella]